MGTYKTSRVLPRLIDFASVNVAATTALTVINSRLELTADALNAPLIADWDRAVWGDEEAAKVC